MGKGFEPTIFQSSHKVTNQLTQKGGDLLSSVGAVGRRLVVLGALLLELHLAQVHHRRSHLFNKRSTIGFFVIPKENA